MRADRTQSRDTATRGSDDNERDLSANPPPPPRRVPNEILLKIIGHLAGDRSSLAKCMRVSPDVNAMAAPLLYHNISWSWGSKHGFPLIRPVQSKRLARETRLTATKQENLEKINILTIMRDHPECQCPGNPVGVAIPPPVIEVGVLRTSLRLGHSGCPSLRRVCPTKLVADGFCTTSGTLLPDYLHGAKNITLHLHVGADWYRALNGHPVGLSWLRPANVPGSQCITNLTLICRLAHEARPDGLYDCLQGLMAQLAGCRNGEDPIRLEITIVNIAGVEGRMRQRSISGPAGLITRLEKIFNDNGGESDSKIKFVSKQDYIANYDWTGEFRQEEVDQWLYEGMFGRGTDCKT